MSAKISRRKFLTRSSALAAVGLGVYAFGVEPRWTSIERHCLPIPDLPPHLEGATAVQLSDLHVGSRVSDAYLVQQFEFVDSLKPEFVFFTGDFIDDASDWHLEKGLRMLPRFPRGSIGNACVLGNHDYGTRHRNSSLNVRNSVTLVDAFNDHGLNLLLDESIELGGLKIAGLRDLWHGGFNTVTSKDAVYSVSDQASIVLSHNPDTVDFPIWDSYRSWVLCGHTHGGQCNFPILGAPIVPVQNKRYVSGFYDIEGGHKLYVSRGVGHTHRVRFGARPEITIFTLTSANAAQTELKHL